MKTAFTSAVAQLLPLHALSKTKLRSATFTTRCRRNLRSVAWLMAFLIPGSLSAQPLSVVISSAQYTTYVEATTQGFPDTTYPPISRTTVSSSPISDEIDMPFEMFSQVGTNYVIANAGLFEVSDRTGWGRGNASATSQLWFSPLVDQTQTIGIQIYAVGATQPQMFTAGQVSLFDLTADSELWNYSWSVRIDPYAGPGNVPWDPADNSRANFNLDTDFLASHQYELTMMTCSCAGDDTEIVQIQLTGLDAVPEPSVVSLILLALPGLPALRRTARSRGFLSELAGFTSTRSRQSIVSPWPSPHDPL